MMKTKKFFDIEDFVDEVDDAYRYMDYVMQEDGDFSPFISIIAQYKEAKEIIECLILRGYRLDFAQLEDCEWAGYDDAFIVTLNDCKVSCEKMKKKKGYLNDESDLAYILDDCNSKIISHVKSGKVYEVNISTGNRSAHENDLCDDYDYIDYHDYPEPRNRMHEWSSQIKYETDEDGEVYGFTYTKAIGDGTLSHSVHCSEPLSDDEITDMILEIGF